MIKDTYKEKIDVLYAFYDIKTTITLSTMFFSKVINNVNKSVSYSFENFYKKDLSDILRDINKKFELYKPFNTDDKKVMSRKKNKKKNIVYTVKPKKKIKVISEEELLKRKQNIRNILISKKICLEQ